MWTNAAQAKRVPGRAQGDGKQPVSKFSKPEPARQPTAEPVSASTHSEDNQDPMQTVEAHGPAQEVTVKHEGDQHTVTSTHADGHKHHSKHASAEEAHQAASQLSGAGPQQAPEMQGNPVASMM
jgi:hypothetical protein